MNSFWKQTCERAIRTFLQGYLSVWLVSGADYDSLFSGNNWKSGVVAAALSVAMSLGLRNAGPSKNSPSAV
jgi:hypothetical protein